MKGWLTPEPPPAATYSSKSFTSPISSIAVISDLLGAK